MKLTMRPYRDKEDYWRIRAFLREVFVANGWRELSWPVARLDYWRWHVIENCGVGGPVDQVTFLWETAEGRIAAVLNPEGPEEAFLQVHPAFRNPELEEQMITLAEQRLAPEEPDGRKLVLRTSGDDTLREDLLRGRGYDRGAWTEHKRSRVLDAPLPELVPPPGYSVRALGGEEELPSRSWASWRAFHPEDPDEDYDGWEWYGKIQRMPLYRRDLDIVAVTADGEVATLWYDDVTRSGYFEPVGTVPEHQRRGLATAVMLEAMRRLQQMGGTLATVGGLSAAADALYSSVMSPEAYLLVPWVRTW